MNPDLLPDWWDPYSSQPYKLQESDKPRTSVGNIIEYMKIAVSVLALGPFVALRYSFMKPFLSAPADAHDFVGLSVTPDTRFNDAIVDMVDDLNVRNLMVRVPCWEADQLEPYLELMNRLPDRDFAINILQSRDSIRDPDNWQRQVSQIVAGLSPRARTYQIGNAINRSKWGCRHSGQWLDLMDRAMRAINEIKNASNPIEVAGSSVIDFEPLVTLRTLFNFHPQQFDICASLLYINRRGSPDGRQYGVFNLERKIRLIAAMLAVSNVSGRRLWISETNWPLLDTKPYTPNSGHPRSTVDEATQADYLTHYFKIAWRSQLVERVYWWQLINPGYGLVDHRGGTLRKMPSYYAFKKLMEGTLVDAPKSNPRVNSTIS
ncbi:MAG: hypothetical protein DHS20C01_21660 [marine bacterium B5-7]|nr:MAG: hypothetical protein DHS20C01_21660 [marine bacterium B5-7]